MDSVGPDSDGGLTTSFTRPGAEDQVIGHSRSGRVMIGVGPTGKRGP